MLLFLALSYLLCLCHGSAIYSRLSTSKLPETSDDDITYRLFTRSGPQDGFEINVNNVAESNFTATLQTKFFVHGWTTDPKTSPWFSELREQYFKRGDYNLIEVNWSKLGNKTYPESIALTPRAGQILSKFIASLVANNGALAKDIHLLGHSLGSHMVGCAGKEMIKNGVTLSRITGLDPAGPVYEKPVRLPESVRLVKTDADFVDVIHTDIGEYGYTAAIGHIDFYPNGGARVQPGCETTVDENCSHARSTKFYVESVNSKNFVAKKCENWNDFLKDQCTDGKSEIMGEDTDQGARGVYYLKTNPTKPYARG